ncbi:MAG: plasmid pRiA4b ORF-3 family protein [Erysipelotrichaceae bacterium]|nr:plasmid pRiA4b ORF-3 family protein [Erysipelotrichaceae bacterium]
MAQSIEVQKSQLKERIINSNNPEIIKKLKAIKKIFPKDDFEIFMIVTIDQTVEGLDDENMDIDDISESHLVELVQLILETAQESIKSLTIKVELEYLEDEYYRIMEVPYDLTLSDFAYFILGSFKADGSHLFSVNHKKQRYTCDLDSYGELYASETFIGDLNLRKNSHIEVEYDFGDEWLFEVTVLKTNKHKMPFNVDDAYIIEGKGYNIWEDEHSLMEYYFNDHERFIKRIEENGFEEEEYIEDFHLDEVFNIENANRNLIKDYRHLRFVYEE